MENKVNNNINNNYLSFVKEIKKKPKNIKDFGQDNEDVLKQLAEITMSDDKSFESPIIMDSSKTIFYDYKIDLKQMAKDNNVPLTPSATKEKPDKNKLENEKQKKYMKDVLEQKNNVEKNSGRLNQKLKNICSSITYSNIYLKQFEILMQFTKYIDDRLFVLYYFEPINELFDIISELIYIIQKQLTSNELLTNELQNYKCNNKICNEKILMRLQKKILDKDKEIIELNNKLKNYDYSDKINNGLESLSKNYSDVHLEINGLKQENKELYNKLNTYRNKVIRIESDNKLLQKKINSFVSEKNRNIENIPLNFYTTNFSNTNKLGVKQYISFNNERNRNNIRKEYNTKNFKSIGNPGSNSHSKNKNSNKNISINLNNNDINTNSKKSKINSAKRIFDAPDQSMLGLIEKNSNSADKFEKKKKPVGDMISVLKEVNEMLRLYDSSLNKMDNCKIEEKKMINFLGNMDTLFKKIYSYIDTDNGNKSNKYIGNNDKQIYVNINQNKYKNKIYSMEVSKKNKNFIKIKEDEGNSENDGNRSSLRYIMQKGVLKSGCKTASEGQGIKTIENYCRYKKISEFKSE